MKYNFDEINQRRGTDCVKWDSYDDAEILPLWVADMDFKTAPAITEALARRVSKGIFGYSFPGKEYYRAVKDWFKTNHDWTIEPEWVICTPGIVPALSAIVKAYTKPGDKVLIMPPVYNCFFSSVKNNGCEPAEVPLIYDNGKYRADFENLEKTVSDPTVKIMILCNPHNPAGKLWTREELERIGNICIENGVKVLSDEIHCEFTYNGEKYTPFATLGEKYAQNSVSCVSPSKAFNIAGLQISSVVCKNPEMRAKIDRAVNDNEVCDVNPFGVIATVAAYDHGKEWLDQMLGYVYENYLELNKFCKEKLPLFKLAELHATYLAWMDCRILGLSSEELETMLEKEAKIKLSPGSMYGEAGDGFMRWNLACPRSILMEAAERFRRFAEKCLREQNLN